MEFALIAQLTVLPAQMQLPALVALLISRSKIVTAFHSVLFQVNSLMLTINARTVRQAAATAHN